MGGDYLYRWGNPQAYDRGSNSNHLLGDQHSVNWIPTGYPGAGNLILFNNFHESNHSSIIGPSDYSTTVGNANLANDSLGLNAQKTVSYEVGLWQELGKNTSLEVNLYYRDIYDLLSLATISTYNQVEYGIYTNKDYGNVRGIEFKFDSNYGNFEKFAMSYIFVAYLYFTLTPFAPTNYLFSYWFN